MSFQKSLEPKFYDGQLGHDAESPLEPLKAREKWAPSVQQAPGGLSGESQADEKIQALVDQVKSILFSNFKESLQ